MAYRTVLRRRDLRRLWLGASASMVGDGMTFVALAWLVLNQPHPTRRLGLLTVAYTAPVFVGGALTGPLLDRFDKRTVLAVDSLLRGLVVLTVPVTAVVHTPPFPLLVVVAASHGLGKMVPLAGFPSALPSLVPAGELDAANALESLSFGLAGVAGPPLAGVLIAAVGAANVLAVDAVSFLVFAVAAATVRTPLSPAPRTGESPTRNSPIRLLLRSRVLLATTVAFMLFNIAEGMLMVVLPWLAKNRLTGGASSLGLLLAAVSVSEIAGASGAGARPPAPHRRVTAISAVQLLAGACFLGLLLEPSIVAIAVSLMLLGLLTGPMTVWAQALRMQLIPAEARGRTFALLRTLMQATTPIGAAAATPLLTGSRLTAAVVAMSTVAAVPAVGLMVAGRDGASRTSGPSAHA